MSLTAQEWIEHSRSMERYCRDKVKPLAVRYFWATLAGDTFQAWVIRRRIQFFIRKADSYAMKASLIHMVLEDQG